MSGEQLKEKLQSLDVNLRELAAKLGYNSDQRLHSKLNADDIKTGFLADVAHALDVPIGWFFDENSGDKNKQSIIKLTALVRNQQKTIHSQQETIESLTKLLTK